MELEVAVGNVAEELIAAESVVDTLEYNVEIGVGLVSTAFVKLVCKNELVSLVVVDEGAWSATKG